MLYFEIIKELDKHNFEGVLVGGAVRDFLTGEEPVDYDVATNADPETVKEIFESKYKVSLVGQSFKVCIIRDNAETVEVATYRKERSTGYGHKEFEILKADTLEEDTCRRDLTINSLAICAVGDIIDYHDGLNDLEKKIIKFVNNAVERIEEDPIRMIRACRFLAKINGTFDKDSFLAIQKRAHLIDTVPKERIKLEIIKAMKNKYSSRFFYALHEGGLLSKIFPSLSKCYNHPHGNHHLEDIFEHSMLVGDAISTKCPLIKLAGYLHDVGKPESVAYDSEWNIENFIGHEKIGAYIVEKELLELRFSLKEIQYIKSIISVHMRSLNNISGKGLRKLIRDFESLNIRYIDFLRIKIADRCGNLKKDKLIISEIKEKIRLFENEIYSQNENKAFSIKDLKINGEDILKQTGLKPGPEIGNILKRLFEIVLEDPCLNTKEKLLTLI